MLSAGRWPSKNGKWNSYDFLGRPLQNFGFPTALRFSGHRENEGRMKDKILEGAAQKKNSIYHFLRPSAGEKHKGYP